MSESERLSSEERAAIIVRLRHLALGLRQKLIAPDAKDDSLAPVLDELDRLEAKLDPGDIRTMVDDIS